MNNYWYLTCHEIKNTANIKNSSCFYKWPINESKCVIIIKLDGDYIDVYLNDLNNHKENLKLRSAEATSSNVLTIMSAGTKVKNSGIG